MRKIPPHITDETIQNQLLNIDRKIDEKMKRVNVIREQSKKGGFSEEAVAELKKLGTEIDAFDQEWKRLIN